MQRMTDKHYNHYKTVLKQCNGDKCATYAALQKEMKDNEPVTEEDLTKYFFYETCVDFAQYEVAAEHMKEHGYTLKDHIYKKG